MAKNKLNVIAKFVDDSQRKAVMAKEDKKKAAMQKPGVAIEVEPDADDQAKPKKKK